MITPAALLFAAVFVLSGPARAAADPAAYDAQAHKLANMFAENFKMFEADVTPAVKAAGPNA